MKAQELTNQTKEELQNLLSEKRALLCQTRFSVKSRQTKNHQNYKHLRRDIARILTVLNEKYGDKK
ncbi:MAG: 50S ribosomal protein L29 [Candidatus Moraniibacteriota bacterium]